MFVKTAGIFISSAGHCSCLSDITKFTVGLGICVIESSRKHFSISHFWAGFDPPTVIRRTSKSFPIRFINNIDPAPADVLAFLKEIRFRILLLIIIAYTLQVRLLPSAASFVWILQFPQVIEIIYTLKFEWSGY